jgi:indolepyruvate ferredoxin oxidoreductase alpha subunit
VPVLCLNVTYPLVPQEIRSFCADKKAVLIVEEGFPEYIEQMVATELRRGDIQTRLYGKDVLPPAGEYTQEVLMRGLAQFLIEARPRPSRYRSRGRSHQQADRASSSRVACLARHAAAAADFLHRLSGASGLLGAEADAGRRPATRISRPISAATASDLFAPFSMGNSVLGYGMSLASAAAVGPNTSTSGRSRSWAMAASGITA